MLVLGIETSCDETGLAIYDSQQGLLGHCLHSQVDIHAEYGGVVPELASRDHIRKTLPLVQQLLEDCQLQADQLDGVAYTAGPGLMGALLVGAAVGRALAYGWQIPAIGVHHMEAHMLAPMLEDPAPSGKKCVFTKRYSYRVIMPCGKKKQRKHKTRTGPPGRLLQPLPPHVPH